jgi:hypothetical protein
LSVLVGVGPVARQAAGSPARASAATSASASVVAVAGAASSGGAVLPLVRSSDGNRGLVGPAGAG